MKCMLRMGSSQRSPQIICAWERMCNFSISTGLRVKIIFSFVFLHYSTCTRVFCFSLYYTVVCYIFGKKIVQNILQN